MMENNAIKLRIYSVFEDLFDLEGIALDTGLKRDDVEEWDSLGHIRLLLAIEDEFDIKIQANEMADFKSIESIFQYLVTVHSLD